MNDPLYEYFCLDARNLNSQHTLSELLSFLLHVLGIVDEAWWTWNARRHEELGGEASTRKGLGLSEYRATSAQAVLDWAEYTKIGEPGSYCALFTRERIVHAVQPLRSTILRSHSAFLGSHTAWVDLVRDAKIMSRVRSGLHVFTWSPDKHRLLMVAPCFPAGTLQAYRAKMELRAAARVSVLLPGIVEAARVLET